MAKIRVVKKSGDNQNTTQPPPTQYIQKPMFNDDPAYTKYADSVLAANMNKNFVQRYLYPDKYPQVQTNTLKGNDPKGKPYSSYPADEYSTHLMGYDPVSKRVFPTIVQDKNGKLRQLDNGGESWEDYTDRTGEYIQFKTAEEAKKFADNGYKRGNQYVKAQPYNITNYKQQPSIFNQGINIGLK